MKRLMLLILMLLVVAAGLLYIGIPSTLHIKQTSIVPVNARGFSRVILDEKKWSQWWPGEVASTTYKGSPVFSFNNNTYRIIEKKFSSFILLIGKGNEAFTTELFFIPVNGDTMLLNWEAQHASSWQPATRLATYYKAKALSKDLQTILEKIKSFYSNEASIYGVPIQKTNVVDSALISTSTSTNGYPSIENIYDLVEQLQAFAQKNGAKQTAPPMLNITTIDSLTFLTKVALPVNKKLRNEGAIQYRWMMGGGNILSVEVKGGPYTINNVFGEMENYITDFKRTAPAIPFQSLITDRRKEPDTSKWVTKLYWPVM